MTIATGVLTYALLLILPWALAALTWRLRLEGPGLENLRLFLYALIMIVAGVAAFTFVSTEQVTIHVATTTTGPLLDRIDHANDNAGPHDYLYANRTLTTTAMNITVYDPAAGVGRQADALTLGGMYGALSLLFLVLTIAETFRLAEYSIRNARRVG